MDLIGNMKAFVEVVDAGSFTAAADAMDVSKNKVSKQISALEDHLNVRLLNRTTRQLHLTEAGRLYHQRAVSLLGEIDALNTEMTKSQNHPKGNLVVSAPVSLGENLLIPFMGDFLDQYQDVTVDLRLSDRNVNLVEEGFDVVIRVGTLQDSGLIAKKLTSTSIMLVASPDYLQAAPPIDGPQDLDNHECIVDTNFRHGATWPFKVNGAVERIKISGRLSVNSAVSAKQAALSGHGIAMCPEFIARNDLESGHLVPVLNGALDAKTNIYALMSHSKFVPPKTRAFIDFLAQSMK